MKTTSIPINPLFKTFILLAVVLMPCLLRAQNRVMDGNFEAGTPFTDPVDISNKYQVFSTTKPMGDWTIVRNTVDKHNKAYMAMGCPPGGYDHHIDLNPSGAMTQMIRGLVPGTRYRFSFYTSLHQQVMTYCSASGTASMKAELGPTGALLLSEVLVLNKADVAWTRHNYSFVAVADTVLLTLSGEGSCNGGGGVLIDEVEIVSEGTDPCVPYVHFANAGRDTLYCAAADSVDISLAASGGVSYSWAPAAAFSDPHKAVVTARIAKATTFVVTVTNDDGCVDKDTVWVDVHANPDVRVLPAQASACKGDTLSLSASGAVQYSWQPLDGLTRNGVANTAAVVTGPAIYTVTGKAADGCTGTDTVRIGLNPDPVVSAVADRTTLDCLNNSLLLRGSGALSYEWSPAVYCETPLNAVTTARPAQDVTFQLTGKNEYGCTGRDSVRILVEGAAAVTLPNAFTPNNDKLNDDIGLVGICDFQMEEWSIYHRNGKRVFHTTNASARWDGTSDGERCNAGVYMYYVKGYSRKGERIIHKGDITLIR